MTTMKQLLEGKIGDNEIRIQLYEFGLQQAKFNCNARAMAVIQMELKILLNENDKMLREVAAIIAKENKPKRGKKNG